MSSGQSNFVPLPFFMDDPTLSGSKDDDKTKRKEGEGHVQAGMATSSFPQRKKSADAGPAGQPPLPTDFFSSNFAAEAAFFASSKPVVIGDVPMVVEEDIGGESVPKDFFGASTEEVSSAAVVGHQFFTTTAVPSFEPWKQPVNAIGQRKEEPSVDNMWNDQVKPHMDTGLQSESHNFAHAFAPPATIKPISDKSPIPQVPFANEPPFHLPEHSFAQPFHHTVVDEPLALEKESPAEPKFSPTPQFIADEKHTAQPLAQTLNTATEQSSAQPAVQMFQPFAPATESSTRQPIPEQQQSQPSTFEEKPAIAEPFSHRFEQNTVGHSLDTKPVSEQVPKAFDQTPKNPQAFSTSPEFDQHPGSLPFDSSPAMKSFEQPFEQKPKNQQAPVTSPISHQFGQQPFTQPFEQKPFTQQFEQQPFTQPFEQQSFTQTFAQPVEQKPFTQPFEPKPASLPFEQKPVSQSFEPWLPTAQVSGLSSRASVTEPQASWPRRASAEAAHYSAHHPADNPADAISLANSSFVIEGSSGKGCERCGKQNEMMANFCCRCGANIASPVESPTESQVFSVGSAVSADQSSPYPSSQLTSPPAPSMPSVMTTSAMVTDQMGRLSLSTQMPQRRDHPVVSFGFGGRVFLTFPTLQTRYNPNGQPINSYRPSLVHLGGVGLFPGAQETISAQLDAAPLVGKQPNELAATLKARRESSAGEECLILAVLEALLAVGGAGKVSAPESTEKLVQMVTPFLPKQILAQSPANNLPCAGETGKVADLVSAGRIVEACEAAMEERLWAHALLLAHLTSPALHQRAVAQLAQQDFPAGHPARIVYLMLTGQPHLVEAEFSGCRLGEGWGPILAALLANRKSPSDGAIFLMLGDALAQQGLAVPAQVSYLLSGQDDSILASGRVRLLDNSLSLTEAWEAVRMASGHPSLPHLFPLKLAHIQLLLDAGMGQLAIQHCHALSLLLKKTETGVWRDAKFLEAFEAVSARLHEFAQDHPSMQMPSGTESGSWFPKVGGLMDVLDRGLNRVIGMDDQSADGRKSPKIVPQIDVAAEKMAPTPTPAPVPHPFSQPQQQHQQQQDWSPTAAVNPSGFAPTTTATTSPHAALPQTFSPIVPPAASPELHYQPPVLPTQAPVGGFDPFSSSRRSSIEQQSPIQPAAAELQQQQNQPWQQQSQPWQQQQSHQQQSQPWQQQQSQPWQQQQSQPWQNQQQHMQQHVLQENLQPQQTQQQSPQMPFAPMQSFAQMPSPSLAHQMSMPNLASGTEPIPPTTAPHQPPSSASMDDFGIGNNTGPSSKKTTDTGEKKDSPLVQPADDSDTGSKSSLLSGLLGGLFRRRKDTTSSPAPSAAGSAGSAGPVKANLGESEMKLVYDEVKKQWVRKDTGTPPVAEAAAPPPPSMMSQPATGESAPISYRRGQASGARGRYVDAFGAEATVPAPSAARANLIPTPSFVSLSDNNPDQMSRQPSMQFEQPHMQENFNSFGQQQNQAGPFMQPSHNQFMQSGNGQFLQSGSGPFMQQQGSPSMQPSNIPSMQSGNSPSMQSGNGPSIQSGNAPAMQPGNGQFMQQQNPAWQQGSQMPQQTYSGHSTPFVPQQEQRNPGQNSQEHGHSGPFAQHSEQSHHQGQQFQQQQHYQQQFQQQQPQFYNHGV